MVGKIFRGKGANVLGEKQVYFASLSGERGIMDF